MSEVVLFSGSGGVLDFEECFADVVGGVDGDEESEGEFAGFEGVDVGLDFGATGGDGEADVVRVEDVVGDVEVSVGVAAPITRTPFEVPVAWVAVSST